MTSHLLDNGGVPADPQPALPPATAKSTTAAPRPVADGARAPSANGPRAVAPAAAPPPRSAPSAAPPPSVASHIWVWVVFLCILGALCVGGWYYWQAHERSTAAAASQPAARPIPIVAVPAKKTDFNVFLQAPGNVAAYNTVTVRSRVDGQLMEVHFTEGQTVHAGDLLFHIDPRPFQVQLTQAQGQLARDEASLKNAQLDLQRYQLAREAITGQQIDTAAAAVAQFQGAIETDKGVIQSAQLNIAYCDIAAPITGRIGLRMVDQGNLVHASDASGLAVITQVQPIAVLFSLRQDDLQAVLAKLNANEKPPVEVFNGSTTSLAEGQLETVDNEIDPTTGTARFKASFANADLRLFPSEFVNVKMLIDTKKGAIAVPAAAVQRGPNNNSYVYVVKDDNTVEMRQVTPGLTQEETTLIDKGIAEGDMVVTDGVDKLRDGTKVTIRQPGAGTQAADGAATGAGAGPGTGPGGRGGGRGGRRGGRGGAASQTAAPENSAGAQGAAREGQ